MGFNSGFKGLIVNDRHGLVLKLSYCSGTIIRYFKLSVLFWCIIKFSMGAGVSCLVSSIILLALLTRQIIVISGEKNFENSKGNVLKRKSMYISRLYD